MVVRRRELIQYGERTGKKRSVAVESVWGAISHGLDSARAASGWCAQPRLVVYLSGLVWRCLGLGAGAAARYG